MLRLGIESVLDAASPLMHHLLDVLSPQDRSAFLANCHTRRVAACEVVIDDGEVSREVGVIISGALGLTTLHSDGRKHILGVLVQGDLFGRSFDQPTTARLETLSECRLCSFDRAAFESMLTANPAAEDLIMDHALDDLQLARDGLILMGIFKVVDRVAALLTSFALRARKRHPHGPLLVKLPVTRLDLALYLGTTRESLSRSFHRLADLGLIRLVSPKEFEILDLAGLMDCAGPNAGTEPDKRQGR